VRAIRQCYPKIGHKRPTILTSVNLLFWKCRNDPINAIGFYYLPYGGYPYGHDLFALNRFRTICNSVESPFSAFYFWHSSITKLKWWTDIYRVQMTFSKRWHSNNNHRLFRKETSPWVHVLHFKNLIRRKISFCKTFVTMLSFTNKSKQRCLQHW